MKRFLGIYFFTLMTLLILDALWLGIIAKDSYAKEMGSLLREEFPTYPWVVFYLMYSFVIVCIVVKPNLEHQNAAARIACTGALLGLASYGAYNLTNYTVIRDWPLAISIVDWMWGVFVTAMSSLGGYYFYAKKAKQSIFKK